jgi:hypothetical protein
MQPSRRKGDGGDRIVSIWQTAAARLAFGRIVLEYGRQGERQQQIASTAWRKGRSTKT